MARTSVITHPANVKLALIREDLVGICIGAPDETCAAMLLNDLISWTDNKNAANEQAKVENQVDQKLGKDPTQIVDLWIWQSVPEFQDKLCGNKGLTLINNCLLWLTEKGYVQDRKNPRVVWDHTKQYLVNIETVQKAINEWSIEKPQWTKRQPKKKDPNRDIIEESSDNMITYDGTNDPYDETEPLTQRMITYDSQNDNIGTIQRVHSIESNTDTSYPNVSATPNIQTTILSNTRGAQSQDKGNILIDDDALPVEEKTEVPPASTQVKTSISPPRLPPRPVSRSMGAPPIDPQPAVLPTESKNFVPGWKLDEDGDLREVLPPENGLSPAEQNEVSIKPEGRKPTALMIARDAWTTAVLRQFGKLVGFDFGADYKKPSYAQYVRTARLLRQAAEDYMKKNPGVIISPELVDAMWGVNHDGWLFSDKKLDWKVCSPAVIMRYFLEYIGSQSSPMAKAKAAEEKQAQLANIVFIEEFDISKYEGEARQRREAEKQRQAKAKAYNPLNTLS